MPGDVAKDRKLVYFTFLAAYDLSYVKWPDFQGRAKSELEHLTWYVGNFFPGLALVGKSFSRWADAPQASSEWGHCWSQSPVGRTGLATPAHSWLEPKPAEGQLWNIVPGRALTKLYQEAYAVYRQNLGCSLSSPGTPYGESVQKTDNLRNKLSPVLAECASKEPIERMGEASDPNLSQGWLWQLEP